MEYRPITDTGRDAVNAFLRERWHGTDMIVHGERIDMTRVEGIAAYDNDAFAGLVTYRIADDECEILSLDSLREGRGVGSALISQIVEIAKEKHCRRIKVTTTNDNTDALLFYQKRGFTMARLYVNAIETARRMKPSIPLTGHDGIPIRDEIELMMEISD